MIIFKYLTTLIINNIIKSVLLFISILCLCCANQVPDSSTTKHIVSVFKDAGKYNYVAVNSEGYKVITFSEEKKLDNNGNISYLESNWLAIILYVIFGVSLLVVIIATFMNDDDVGWEFPETWEKTMLKEVRCEDDGGIYNYSLRGKLLLKSDVIVDDYALRKHVSAYCTTKNIFPDYKGTKSQIRDTKIKDIVT